jgi:hypothetical protein
VDIAAVDVENFETAGESQAASDCRQIGFENMQLVPFIK